MDAAEIVTAYYALVARAVEAVGSHHYSSPDEDTARIEWTADGKASLCWSEQGYDGMDNHSVDFDPAILDMDDTAFAAWKLADAARREREESERHAAYQAQTAERERAQYEALRRKFG